MNRTVFLSDLTSHSYGSRSPSAPLRRLRGFFLLAPPPLLFQEGNSLSWQFIYRPPLQCSLPSRSIFSEASRATRHRAEGTHFPKFSSIKPEMTDLSYEASGGTP